MSNNDNGNVYSPLPIKNFTAQGYCCCFLLLLLFYTMLLQVAICSQNKMNGMGNHGWLANEDCKCSRKGLTPGRNRVKDLF